jgi:hypothetical protein
LAVFVPQHFSPLFLAHYLGVMFSGEFVNQADKYKSRQINIFVICTLIHFAWLGKLLVSYEEALKEYGFFPILVFIAILTLLSHISERFVSHLIYSFKMRK